MKVDTYMMKRALQQKVTNTLIYFHIIYHIIYRCSVVGHTHLYQAVISHCEIEQFFSLRGKEGKKDTAGETTF